MDFLKRLQHLRPFKFRPKNPKIIVTDFDAERQSRPHWVHLHQIPTIVVTDFDEERNLDLSLYRVTRIARSNSSKSIEPGANLHLSKILEPHLYPQNKEMPEQSLRKSSHTTTNNTLPPQDSTRLMPPKMHTRTRKTPRTTTAPVFPPGLPVPLHLQKDPPQQEAKHADVRPATPRLSIRRSTEDKKKPSAETTEAGPEVDIYEIVLSFRNLNETQLWNARKCMCYYQLQYHLTFDALPPPPTSDEDKRHAIVHLMNSAEALRISPKRVHQLQVHRRHGTKLSQENSEWADNVVKSLTGRNIPSIHEESPAETPCIWSPKVRNYKRQLIAKRKEQDAMKAALCDEFIVNDYTYRSAKSRKTWLLRYESKLRARVTNSQSGEHIRDAELDSEGETAEDRSRRVRSLAARRLHSSLSSAEIKMLPITWHDEIASSYRKNFDTIVKMSAAAAAVETPFSSPFDTDSEASSVETVRCIGGEAEGEDEVGDLALRNELIAKTRASTAVSLETAEVGAEDMYLQRAGAASQDSIMPGAV